MYGEPRQSLQSGGGLLQERLFVGRYAREVESVEILQGGTQTDGSRDVGGARLEALGRGGEGGLLDGDVVYHVAAPLVGRHLGEALSLAV